MKILKLIGHPFLVSSTLLLVLVSGKSFGGFYLVYVLLGLPYGATHAIIAIAGIGVMIASHLWRRDRPHPVKAILSVIAIGLMTLALIFFFDGSKGYNDGTFVQFLPISSLLLF